MADRDSFALAASSKEAGPNASSSDDSAVKEPSIAQSVWISASMSPLREALFVAIVCMAQFCTQAAYMGTLVLLRDMGSTFGVADPAHLAWLVAGYSLTVGTFILVAGRLGDVLGYKNMLLAGFAWFSLWSLVSGLSVYSDFTLAVFARVLQGVGPALCLPNALAILGSAYPPGHRKAMVFACFGAVAPIGGVCGGVFASLFALAWWPWALWAMAIWLALLCVAAYLIIPEPPQDNEGPRSLRGWIVALDAPAAVVGVVALVLFNFAWTQAPISGWGTPTVLVPLILGLLLFGGFVYLEVKMSEYPLLPFDAFKPDICFVLAALVCGWATFGVWTLYLVQILEDIRGLQPLLVSAYFAPAICAGGAAAFVTGKLLGPLQVRPPVVMMLALTAFTVGIILTAFAPVHQIYWGQIFVSMLIMPFGMDMSFPAATLTLSNAVAKEHQGIGASLVNTVVNYGIALGVGLAGTIEVNVRGSGDSSDDRLRGFRSGLYTGIGLAGLGMGTCIVFLFRRHGG
ncbi:MFS transporter [Cordyceps fumosorosea ARSEF 2679]|uniref:MFS transporter n=1 Tax=Cordyceps fumosorosea (strain ARSEF 2679) TaxID=1081104 RepID=A0A167PL82_CORFA|nr:MFS transporter [Cordyceps fumosorosea ARSEF 2679]OAA56772.1 MFS transporter [Cordyceps fumosorosea ARSEF 2679]